MKRTRRELEALKKEDGLLKYSFRYASNNIKKRAFIMQVGLFCCLHSNIALYCINAASFRFRLIDSMLDDEIELLTEGRIFDPSLFPYALMKNFHIAILGPIISFTFILFALVLCKERIPSLLNTQRYNKASLLETEQNICISSYEGTLRISESCLIRSLQQLLPMLMAASTNQRLIAAWGNIFYGNFLRL